MIRNEKEYKEAVRRAKKDQEIMIKQKDNFKKHGLSKTEINKAMEPMISFHEQLNEEIEWYERVKCQDFMVINRLQQVGQLLIALRIASGLSQKDLAKCLGVMGAQVSRDERNEYHGITLERAQKIMDVFGAHLKTALKVDKKLDRTNIMAPCAV